MRLIAEKSVLHGRVSIPGSKSHTIRAVVLGSLAVGESAIIAPLDSADTRAAVAAYRNLGAEIECGERWHIKGTAGELRVPEDVIDVGNSGTTLRFALGSAALLGEGAAIFTGDEQIRTRPVGPLLKSLNELGADAWSSRGNGKVPAVVRGPLRGGHTSIAAVTSQYLSSLLVNTPLAPEDSVIEVTELNEKPYVEITLRYLDEQQIQYSHDRMRHFEIKGGQKYRAFTKHIPADFSSATFFLCAGVILDGEIVLEGLDFSDVQGDRAVVDILQDMGADIEVCGNEVVVRRSELEGGDVDMNAIPDALPALAVVACFARGRSRLYNVQQARWKETDRIAVMRSELQKMGADITEIPDGLEIRPSRLHAAALHGHADHRVVMALSLAAMAVKGQSSIDTAEAIGITFPDYVKLMQSLGAKMELESGGDA